MMRNVELFLFKSLSIFMLFVASNKSLAQNTLSTVKSLDNKGQMQIQLPGTLAKSETEISAENGQKRGGTSFFNKIELSLGYVGNQSFSIPSSTPQNLNYSPNLIPRITLGLGIRPLYHFANVEGNFTFFATHAQYVSDAHLALAGNAFEDKLTLLAQSIGIGTEIKKSLGAKATSYIGIGLSISRIYAVATKGLRSDSVSVWGLEAKSSLRYYQDTSIAQFFVEASISSTQLARSSQTLKGISLGLSHAL